METEAFEKDAFDVIYRSDTDPHTFYGVGERISVYFHPQDFNRTVEDNIPLEFICISVENQPNHIVFLEVTPDVSDPVNLLHRRGKPIPPSEFYNPEALWPGRRAKQVAAAAAMAAAAGGLTLLAVKRRKR